MIFHAVTEATVSAAATPSLWEHGGLAAANMPGNYSHWPTMPENRTSPFAEPDVIVQIRWSDIGGDRLDLFYEACVSAACRFVAAFNATHTNAVATLLADTAALLLPRLPCEQNWVIP
ncbi:hypothetical protein ACFWM1_26110 [Nocardia sp. NPDC058379]|uniref:hypothetical protein n=1 Tax=unclassified Nocardia TaxID=2637762 RepID=UPI00365D212E